MPTQRRFAISYSRFSDPKQAGGDSERRQERDYQAFCARHKLTPGNEVFADRGRSGYRDEHRKKGRLGQLIAAAKDGRFEPGTVIVIEAWDRLGRLRPDRQTDLIAELLRTGVCIGVCRLDDIFAEDDFGTHKWTTLAVFIQLAYQESKQKAERVAASWERRRQKAREEGQQLTSRVPAWLECVDGTPRIIPERAAAVRRIFALAAAGYGHTCIIQALEKEKVRPFGEVVVREGRTRSQFSGVWTKPYVATILRDRRVLGELQPMKDDKPDGSPLIGHYPSVVTEEEFLLARAGQEERRNCDSLGRKNGPRQGKYVNLFKGMLRHARDGEGWLLHNKGKGAAPELLLVNTKGNGGRSKCYTFPYHVFEEAVLKLLKEVDPKEVLPRQTEAPSQAGILRAKLANIRQDLARLKADLKAGYSKALVEVVREVEEDEKRVTAELEEEVARTARPIARAWKNLPSLIDLIRAADDPDEVRLRLRPILRQLIAEAWLLIVPRGSYRLAVLQLFFSGGDKRRDFLIVHQTAGYRRKGGWSACSLATVEVPDDLDLRKPSHASRLETALGQIDLDALLE